MPPPAEIPPSCSLPFPAGPLLRPATPCASALAATDMQRRKLALSILWRDHEAVDNQANPISKLTVLIAEAGLSHAAATQGPGAVRHATVHPAAAQLQYWWEIVGAGNRELRVLYRDAVADFCARLRERWNRARDEPVWLLVRDTAATKALTSEGAEAPRYRHVASGVATMPASQSTGMAGQITLDKVLAEPGGGWRLLACLFLKLLHAHLAWLPGLDHKADLKQALYDPALLLLQWTARGDTDLAPTAAGLAVAAPRIAPYWEPVNAGAWLPQDLPACFLPELLAAPAATLKQARRMLKHRPGLARQIDSVQALALNVAALLNDLATERCLGLTRTEHAKRASHLHSGGKQWLQALKKADEQALAKLRTTKDFARDELLPRKDLLRTLETWMAQRGCQFAHEAARDDALPLLPALTQPVAARTAAGATA